MKQFALTAFVSALLLALLPGCPNPRRPVETASAVDTGLAAQGDIRETLLLTDTATTAAADSVPVRPETKLEPKPEPRPESPPQAKALPRMWDYGSDNCLPCKEMEKILRPMMQDYAGKVDIRIVNVYQERELTAQARIQIIPTQIFYAPDGKELFRHVGIYPRDSIVGKFKEFGWD